VRAAAASIAPAPVVHGDEWPDGDAIPDLDDFGAPARVAPAESTPSSSLREAINAAVPLRQTRPSVRRWLQDLEERLMACGSREEVDGTLLTDAVCNAHRTLQDAAKERLRAITTEALARWPEPEPRTAGDSLDDAIQF
jgi:hypothetical protein